MPVVNSMGYSEITNIKQVHLMTIFKTHIPIVKSLLRRNWKNFDNRYFYFDINAGSGIDCKGKPGSPLIFLNEAKISNIPYFAIFIDKNKDNTNDLRRLITDKRQVRILTGDHSEIIRSKIFSQKLIQYFGLIYADPNGVFDVDILRDFSNQYQFKRVDILINCNGTAIKRESKSPLCCENRSLKERLSEINKKYWIIREPYGKYQWSFLIGTNWDGFPDFKKWGFYRLDSGKGQAIFERINYTSKELKNNNGQSNLFKKAV